MTNLAATTQTAMTPKLRKRLQEHAAEVAKLREEIGDVPEALSGFVREVFDPAAVAPTTHRPDYKNGQTAEDDDLN